MGNSHWFGFTVSCGMFLFAGAVYALDLKPIDVNAVRVGPCDQQVRFKVVFDKGSTSVTGKSPLANYRIGIYSGSNKKKLITSFSVSDQKIDDVYTFAVPSSSLACEHGVSIVVDDKKQVADSNRANNTARVNWQPPGRGFGSPCAAQLEKCR